MSRILVTPFFRGKEKIMWNMRWVYELPTTIKVIVLVSALISFVCAYYLSKQSQKDEKKPLDEKSKR